MLTSAQREQTGDALARVQRADGCIPWFPGGRWDPWDLVECALALDACGRHREALDAYRFLARHQRQDGAWTCPIVGGREDDEVLDANGATYLTVGVWHHFLCTQDERALRELWRHVSRGMDFALDLQQPDGTIAWARNLRGDPGDHALLSACSCIVLSMRCALAIAHHLGDLRPDWELGLASLESAITRGGDLFADRSRYSMDWYYPVLARVITDDPARARLEHGWSTYVVPGLGTRCVNDRPWITSAETAELTIALSSCGMEEEARQLFGDVQYLRAGDGAYWTGATFPDGRHFPNECSTWSAAAILIADDVIESRGPIADIFQGRALGPDVRGLERPTTPIATPNA